jgi:GT2 family glycosyltransferase
MINSQANKTAILITCYNRVQTTLKCLKNLYLFDKLSEYYDIYLLDDDSSDNTFEIVRSKFPNVIAYKSKGNLFWNGGMNYLWKISSKKNYQNYIWLNDDTILNSNWHDTISLALKTTSGKSLLLGSTICPLNKNISYGGRKNINSNTILSPNNLLQNCNIINGNFVVVPNYVFKRVGFLDSFFSHSLGDIDYGLRVINKGLNNCILPDIIGFCEVNSRLRYDPKSRFIEKIRSLRSPIGLPFKEYLYFNFKHYGLLKSLKFTIGIIISLVSPMVYNKISK